MFNIFKVRNKNSPNVYFVCGIIGRDKFLLYDPREQSWLVSPCQNYVLEMDLT